jgi:hypothetical protein
MKRYNSFEEMNKGDCPEEIIMEVGAIMDASDLPDDTDFTYSLGGEVLVIETLEELHTNVDISADFDVSCILPSGSWVYLVDITNNAGGDAVFVPYELAQEVPELAKIKNINSARSEEISKVTRVSPITGEIVTRNIPITAIDLRNYFVDHPDSIITTDEEDAFIRFGDIDVTYESLK